MPYPHKINAQVILTVAREHLESHGATSLSLRALATDLQVAPNALYRYYADRGGLLAALAEQATRDLLQALQQASEDKEATEAAEAMAMAYLDFAREHPHLYTLMMSPSGVQEQMDAALQTAHEELWDYVVRVTATLVDKKRATEAAMAYWGFLHGMIVLEQGHFYGPRKPREAIAFGLQALLRGMITTPDEREG